MNLKEQTDELVTKPLTKFVDKVLSYTKGKTPEKVNKSILESDFISRDLSWLQFNFRVLDQCRSENRNLFEKLKFLAITSSNFDEFFMIRLGSLYNYIDYNRERIDYSGLRETQFRQTLLSESQEFYNTQNRLFSNELKPQFKKMGWKLSAFQTWRKRKRKLFLNTSSEHSTQ